MRLAMRMGWFLWRMPGLNEHSLPGFLGRIAGDTKGRSAKVGRIKRWRTRWLRVPGLRGRDTCYTRAVVMFRFLQADGAVRFHLGTEDPRFAGDCVHGHAWVTVDGRELEPLPDPIRQRVRELYAFPPAERAAEKQPCAV